MFGFYFDVAEDPLVVKQEKIAYPLFFGDLHQTYDLIFTQFVHPDICVNLFGKGVASPLHHELLFVDRYRPPDPPQEFWAWNYSTKIYNFLKRISCTEDIGDMYLRGKHFVSANPFVGFSWFAGKGYENPKEVELTLPFLPGEKIWFSFLRVRSSLSSLPYHSQSCKILDKIAINVNLNGQKIKLDLTQAAPGSFCCSHPDLFFQDFKFDWLWFSNLDKILQDWEEWIFLRAPHWEEMATSCSNVQKVSWVLADTLDSSLPRNKVEISWQIAKENFTVQKIPTHLKPAAIRYATQDFWGSGYDPPPNNQGDVYFKVNEDSELEFFITEPVEAPGDWFEPSYIEVQYPYLEGFGVYFPFCFWKDSSTAGFYPSLYYAKARESKLSFSDPDVNQVITVDKNNEEEALLVDLLNTISATKLALDNLNEVYDQVGDLANDLIDFFD